MVEEFHHSKSLSIINTFMWYTCNVLSFCQEVPKVVRITILSSLQK